MSRKREMLAELGEALVGPQPEPLPPRSVVVLDKPGIYGNVPMADYHNDCCSRPSLTSSTAKMLLGRSPLRAWHFHPRLGGNGLFKESKALDTGSVIHALVLGKGMTGGGAEYVEIDAPDYKTKDARAKRDRIRAGGRIPILKTHLDACAEVARRLDDVIPASAQREVTAVWESPTGPDREPMLCRRRMDALIVDESLVLDLKTCEDCVVAAAGRTIAAFDRDLEAAVTLDCLDTLFPDRAGRWAFRYVFQEIEPPYDRVEVPMAGAFLETGRNRWRRAREIWQWCMARNEWPGAGARLSDVPPGPPAWYMERDFDEQLLHAEFMRGGPAADLMED